MTRNVTVLAHPNIALAKYWGKRDGDGNVPAVPSLSVTLSGLATVTSVVFDDGLRADELVLGGNVQVGRPLARATALLDRVRKAAEFETRARVVSQNDFPTASGLASSASGFAALALAATRAASLDWPTARVADLARRSSASAARSLFGGFAELDGGEGSRGDARQVAPEDALDLRVLVAVTSEEAKSVSSTDGMLRTSRESPYYAAWLLEAPRIHAALRMALLMKDFERLGELAERSALAMHASAMAAGVVFVSGATLAALAEVRAMRASGLLAYATMDAGPHLKCLVQSADVAAVRARLLAAPGVLRVIEAAPGAGAHEVDPPTVTPSSAAAHRAEGAQSGGAP
jgi:diphosphomevalonate decarboxylase